MAPTAPPAQVRRPGACAICGHQGLLVHPDPGRPEAGWCESCSEVMRASERDIRDNANASTRAETSPPPGGGPSLPSRPARPPAPLPSSPLLPHVEGADQAGGGGASVAAAGALARQDGGAGGVQGKKVPLQEASVAAAGTAARQGEGGGEELSLQEGTPRLEAVSSESRRLDDEGAGDVETGVAKLGVWRGRKEKKKRKERREAVQGAAGGGQEGAGGAPGEGGVVKDVDSAGSRNGSGGGLFRGNGFPAVSNGLHSSGLRVDFAELTVEVCQCP